MPTRFRQICGITHRASGLHAHWPGAQLSPFPDCLRTISREQRGGCTGRSLSMLSSQPSPNHTPRPGKGETTPAMSLGKAYYLHQPGSLWVSTLLSRDPRGFPGHVAGPGGSSLFSAAGLLTSTLEQYYMHTLALAVDGTIFSWERPHTQMAS